jgi:hypothetical protein
MHNNTLHKFRWGISEKTHAVLNGGVGGTAFYSFTNDTDQPSSTNESRKAFSIVS